MFTEPFLLQDNVKLQVLSAQASSIPTDENAFLNPERRRHVHLAKSAWSKCDASGERRKQKKTCIQQQTASSQRTRLRCCCFSGRGGFVSPQRKQRPAQKERLPRNKHRRLCCRRNSPPDQMQSCVFLPYSDKYVHICDSASHERKPA